MLVQLQACEESGIPLAIILGESELQKGVVKLRDVVSRQETEVKRNELVQEINKMLAEKQNT